MRRFIVIGHDAPTDPDFPLSDLPGAAGRLDVLCRSVTAGLLRSHGIRANGEVITVHRNRLAIRFAGRSVRNLNPDERSTAARFRDAIAAAEDAVGAVEVETAAGVHVSRRDLGAVLRDVDGTCVQLHPGGEPITALDPASEYTFVLSDHHPFNDADREVLARTIDRRISLGPVPIHADQAIVVAHNFLDTEGYRAY